MTTTTTRGDPFFSFNFFFFTPWNANNKYKIAIRQTDDYFKLDIARAIARHYRRSIFHGMYGGARDFDQGLLVNGVSSSSFFFLLYKPPHSTLIFASLKPALVLLTLFFFY